jgi:hypothetical protein
MSEQNPHNTLVVDAFPVDDQKPLVPFAGEETPGRLPSAPSFLGSALLLALSRPRVLLFLMLPLLLLPLVVALPVFLGAEPLAPLQANPGGTEIDLPEVAPSWVFREWTRAMPDTLPAAAASLPPLLLFMSLFNLVVTGGWMGLAVSRRREHSLRSFLGHGGRAFFPFLRTWFLGLPLFAFVTWLCWGAPAEWFFGLFLPEGDPALGASESTGRWLEFLRQLVYLNALFKLELWLDLARASLTLGERRSALLAMVRSFWLFLRNPWGLYGLGLCGFGLELLWIAGAEAIRQVLDAPLWPMLLVLPFGRIVMRGMRYAALARFAASRAI